MERINTLSPEEGGGGAPAPLDHDAGAFLQKSAYYLFFFFLKWWYSWLLKVYVCIYILTCVYIYMYLCICIYICTYKCTYLYMYVYTYTYMYIYTCIYTYILTYIYVYYIYTYIHTYIYTYIYTCTYAYFLSWCDELGAIQDSPKSSKVSSVVILYGTFSCELTFENIMLLIRRGRQYSKLLHMMSKFMHTVTTKYLP